ncbi:hypothetical protein HYH03_000449 [Edaphochlamys debaryana]|uniref:Histone H4 n=1 Tax=Edaphochlamys debaryana TaxID=47281 RepID=A0A835YJ82_9CHLO|nr:hypothetical protein HYH03_000449 [Edaphochlamys debaryana]|eukprot:KAG2501951.1 hypothetical protein HYH03_000449 [Edaphochlamys debaryana]
MSGRGKGGKGLGKGGAKRHRKVLRDNIQGITKPAIRRLARRGGVKRISGLIYEETRTVLKTFLENVIRDSVTYTEHARRKTVTAMDVVYALKRQGRTLERELAAVKVAAADIGPPVAELEYKDRNAAERAEGGRAEEQAGGPEEDVPTCASCPLCWHILHAPVTTPCGHTFCARCWQRWVEASAASRRDDDWVRFAGGGGGGGWMLARLPGVVAPASPAAALGVSGGAAAGGAASCPLCRRTVEAALELDEAKALEVCSAHPAAYAARSRELAAEADAEAEAEAEARPEVIVRRLRVGNTHHLLPPAARAGSNAHQWAFFVRLEPAEGAGAGVGADSGLGKGDFIERVVLNLHPTFTPSRLVLTESPFVLRRVGWGVFVIQAEVSFRARWHKPPVVCRWLLDFDGGDVMEADLSFTRDGRWGRSSARRGSRETASSQ